MKTLLVFLFVLTLNTSHCQVMMIGVVSGNIVRADSTEYNPTDTISFIQGNRKVAASTDTSGKYIISFEVDLERPFILRFSSGNHLSKIIQVDLTALDTSEFYFQDDVIELVENLEIEMVKNRSDKPAEISVAKFSENNELGQIELDATHAQAQKKQLNQYLSDSSYVGFKLDSFDLNSGFLQEGSIYRPERDIRYLLNRLTIDSSSYVQLDSIAIFLKEHPNVIVEIGVHTDLRGVHLRSDRFTGGRARNVCSYLIEQGVQSKQLIPVGFSDSNPIIPEAMIRQMKTKEEQFEAHAVNRRTEFTIVSLSRVFDSE